jgi:hypothetical protein
MKSLATVLLAAAFILAADAAAAEEISASPQGQPVPHLPTTAADQPAMAPAQSQPAAAESHPATGQPSSADPAKKSEPQKKESIISFVPDGMKVGDHLLLGSYFQFWYRPYEMAPNGAVAWNGDKGAQIASGFSFRRVRLYTEAFASLFSFRLELAFENGFQLLDAWARLNAYKKYIVVAVGQMKIPSTYENMDPSYALDMITMSTISEVMPNYQLSMHANDTSPFRGYKANQRDMGVGLRGDAYGFGYFLFVGNGLGADYAIGAGESKQNFWANQFGAYFYGVRLTMDFARTFKNAMEKAQIKRLEIGGFFSYNDHQNMVSGDKQTVYDLNRLDYDVELNVAITKYLRLTGMYGWGVIRDNFMRNSKTDCEFYGWEAKVMVAPIPETLELGARVDYYYSELNENGETDETRSYTIGISWRFWDHFRLDFNYKFKEIVVHSMPYQRADSAIFQFQAKL